jgi:hypothetical protein
MKHWTLSAKEQNTCFEAIEGGEIERIFGWNIFLKNQRQIGKILKVGEE